MSQAARAPFMVGMHWFMWSDYAQEGPPGRGPYAPDLNLGLVTPAEAAVCEELGRWITRTNAEVEVTHQAGREGPPPESEPQRRPLPRFLPTVDGEVSEWPRALAITPTMITALHDGVHADQTYFLSWDGQDIYLAGDIAAAQQEHPPMKQARPWARDYLSIQLSPVQTRKPDGDPTPVLFIYPREAGHDSRQPYATRWARSDGYRPILLRVVQRRSPSGFTIEARHPWDSTWGIYGETRDLVADQAGVPKYRGHLSDNVARHRHITTVTTRSAGGTQSAQWQSAFPKRGGLRQSRRAPEAP